MPVISALGVEIQVQGQPLLDSELEVIIDTVVKATTTITKEYNILGLTYNTVDCQALNTFIELP